MTKYTLKWEGPNREFCRDTEDFSEVINVVIGFHQSERGRYFKLPNYWDRLIIEKHQKPNTQSSEQTLKETRDR